MDRVERNGGTAGIVTGLLLALLFVMFFMLGMDVQSPDPATSLQAVAQRWRTFAVTSLVGLLAAGFAVPFVTGIATRLRDASPTRARAVLYLTLIGLAGYALSSVVIWVGGRQVVTYAVRDQAGATLAWLTLQAVNSGLGALGGAFTGAGAIVAGWAIVGTGAMKPAIGWVGIISGILNVATLFPQAPAPVFLGGILATIVWALWAGMALRSPKPAS